MFTIDVSFILTFVASWLQISAIMLALPLFGEMNVPIHIRIFFSFALCLCLFPIISDQVRPFILNANTPEKLALVFAKNMVIGLSIGFIVRIMLLALVTGCNLVGMQMGFGFSSQISFLSEQDANIFYQFHNLFVILLIFSLNLHHLFIKGLVESFFIIQTNLFSSKEALFAYSLKIITDFFKISLRLSFPIIAAILISTFCLGLVARSVPQLNVFGLSFLLSFIVGLVIYAACLPFLSDIVQDQMDKFFMEASSLMHQMAIFRT